MKKAIAIAALILLGFVLLVNFFVLTSFSVPKAYAVEYSAGNWDPYPICHCPVLKGNCVCAIDPQ